MNVIGGIRQPKEPTIHNFTVVEHVKEYDIPFIDEEKFEKKLLAKMVELFGLVVQSRAIKTS